MRTRHNYELCYRGTATNYENEVQWRVMIKTYSDQL
jgi:hypothetical protein